MALEVWATDIYQKVETMWLENLRVQETIYEDTLKYVENQVEEMGSYVKKFYSDVVQDLQLPVCGVSHEDVVLEGLPLGPVPDADNNEKPKLIIFDGNRDVMKTETDAEVISVPSAIKESSLTLCNGSNGIPPQGSVELLEMARTDLLSTKSKEVGMIERPIGIKSISQNNCPSKTSDMMNPDLVDVETFLNSYDQHDREGFHKKESAASAWLKYYDHERILSCSGLPEEGTDASMNNISLPSNDMEVTAPDEEIFETVELLELEETYVVVEGDELLSMEEGIEFPGLKRDHGVRKLPPNDSFESEWELL